MRLEIDSRYVSAYGRHRMGKINPYKSRCVLLLNKHTYSLVISLVEVHLVKAFYNLILDVLTHLLPHLCLLRKPLGVLPKGQLRFQHGFFCEDLLYTHECVYIYVAALVNASHLPLPARSLRWLW